VSGDRPPILVTAERDAVLARAVEALGRFPTAQPWVLIGGLAVFLRLGSITRPTADADTVARSQVELIQQLIADGVTSVVVSGDIQVPIGNGTVEIDVMDLADDPLPVDLERRAFALARRCALLTAESEQVIVTDPSDAVIADATIPVATIAALTALKTVSMVRRPHGDHPHKVGSDIHDLIRLVAEGDLRTIASGLVAFDRELAGWVATQIARAFGNDLRYTLLRLRANDRSPGARALTDDDISATVILSDVLHEEMANG
jgi:hypothetical protein